MIHGRFLPLLAALGAILAGCAGNEVRSPDVYQPSLPQLPHAPPPTSGSLFQESTAMHLFEDRKAHRVGDIITVVLTERTESSKSAKTSTSRESSLDTGTPTLFGAPVTAGGNNVLAASLEAKQGFDGSGDAEQRNSLSGTISVTVADVLANGYLVVRGQKRLVLNQGEEYIQIAGIVRPEDVASDNTIPSTLLADAQISYTGTGTLADANTQGWMTRFFNSAWWPF